MRTHYAKVVEHTDCVNGLPLANKKAHTYVLFTLVITAGALMPLSDNDRLGSFHSRHHLLGCWRVAGFFPDCAKAYFVRHGATTRTVFGSDPKWIIRITGVIMAAVALFMLFEAISS